MEDCSYDKKSKKTDCIDGIPSEFAKSNLFYLQEIGRQCLVPSETYKGERNLSYLFLIVMEGKGKLEYDSASYIISDGYCAFLDCQKAYRYYSVEGMLKINYIYFNGSSMEYIYRKYEEQGVFSCFRKNEIKTCVSVLEQIYNIAASDSNVKELEICTKIISLLSLLMNAGKQKTVPVCRISQRQNLQNVKNYLEENYHERINLDQLSEMFYINKFYLTRLFREQFGISVNNYLIKLRVEQAKMLLLSSNLSVEKIGFECGIGNANYFSKIFKRMEGMPPGEFRRKKRNNIKG